jgi:hypothetical protein
MLQAQFIAYRDEKQRQESAIRAELEETNATLKAERQGHLRDKEMVRLTLETDRLSLKSGYEVRIDLLC